MAALTLFVISVDDTLIQSVHSLARSNGWHCETAAKALEAMALLQSGIAVHALLLDLRDLPGDGSHLLPFITGIRPGLPIIVIDDACIPGRREHSLRLGAMDYQLAPVSQAQVARFVRSCLSLFSGTSTAERMIGGLESLDHGDSFICVSRPMRRLCAKLADLAKLDVPLIISGEPGSGKETIARWVHLHSIHSAYPFLTVDCRGLREEFLERKVFGIDSNALFASRRDLPNRTANGTVFLKHYQEMPLRLQAALMGGMPPNGPALRHPDIANTSSMPRIIASCSTARIEQNPLVTLPPDLLLPPGAVEVLAPPLRDRKEDLALLAEHFITEFAAVYGLARQEPDAASRKAWLAYDWPGNLSELRQAVKCFLMRPQPAHESSNAHPEQTSSLQTVLSQAQHVPANAVSYQLSTSLQVGSVVPLRKRVRRIRQETEKNAIAEALQKTAWNRMAAARALEISYRSILYKIAQYQMSPPRSSHLASLAASGASQVSGEVPGIGRVVDIGAARA